MKVVFSVVIFFWVGLVNAASINKGAAPGSGFRFMDGYKYEYSGCTASWDAKVLALQLSGEKCHELSAETVRSDVMKSVDYVLSQGRYNSFAEYYTAVAKKRIEYTSSDAIVQAVRIWERACLDFKNGLNTGDFPGNLKMDEAIKSHPWLKRNAVVRLYSDGWDFSRNMKGILDCSYFAADRANAFTSGIDIRNN